MFNRIRQHATLIAAILLLWMAHATLGGEGAEKKAKGKARLAGIGSDTLAVRDADTLAAPIRDPLGIRIEEPAPPAKPAEPEPDAPEPSPEPQVVYGSEDYASAWSDAIRGLVADAATELSRWDPLGLRAARRSAVEPPALPAVPFSLVLDATMGQGGHGQARISGQTVTVGQPIVGMDPNTPPILESVHGTTAIVRYRERRLVLDLDVRPRIDIAGGAVPRPRDGR